jgi:hypothetical protein
MEPYEHCNRAITSITRCLLLGIITRDPEVKRLFIILHNLLIIIQNFRGRRRLIILMHVWWWREGRGQMIVSMVMRI